MNSRLQDNDTEMYLTHSQQKSVVAESMKSVYARIDNLAEIVYKYSLLR